MTHDDLSSTRRMAATAATARCLTACLVVLMSSAGCDRERRPPPVYAEAAPQVIVGWSPPATIEPLVGEEPVGPAVDLAGTRRFPECSEMLEHDGRPLDPFPFAERNDRAERLASCGVEGIARLDDGALALAWSTNATRGSRVTDLRLAVWNANGSLRWFADLDRSREAANWVANFRHSFITPFGDHLCAGTLWEGDTQVMCLEVKNGQATWKGSLPFWSGIDPQPGDNGLIVADLSAITQRYPFSGAEMRHQKLEGLGGRAGYYSSDGKRLYFAPSRVDAPPLIAYDLATFEEQWRTPLPAAPTSTLAEAFARFHRLLVQVDEQLFALDTESGAIAWAYDIGADVPTIAADDASIYVLARRADLPNRLVALDPATGKRRWSANMPSGTLRVDVVDGVLLVGSIRAVQRVLVPAEAAPDAD